MSTISLWKYFVRPPIVISTILLRYQYRAICSKIWFDLISPRPFCCYNLNCSPLIIYIVDYAYIYSLSMKLWSFNTEVLNTIRKYKFVMYLIRTEQSTEYRKLDTYLIWLIGSLFVELPGTCSFPLINIQLCTCILVFCSCFFICFC